jgi:hypothetical protein
MRLMRRVRGTALLLCVGTSSLAAGCPFNALEDCEQNATLSCYWDRFEQASTGGDDGGTPPACVPSANADPVSDACGVFVAKGGDDSNDGTRESPVATLARAVELAQKESGRVYACAETFEEALVIDNRIEMYGGLDCAKGWAYAGATAKTMLTAAADAIPLVMKSSASGARVEDFAIHAVDAVKEGGSSIAVLADGAMAELVRCELVAGSGAKGADGADGDPSGTVATAGAAGSAGKDACSDVDGTPGPDALLSGGAQVTNDCGNDAISIGGRGGDGNVTNGGGGDVGQIGTKGQAGIGEPSMGTWDCVPGSGQGTSGSSGEVGAPGTGATGLGSLSASGYLGANGGAGALGKAGQGGGGGGGAKGGKICAGGVAGSGASGGSGGAGGCGGLPGQGGGSGGASIALVSLSASVTLTDCSLTSSKGGDGGAGGDAQGGGPGGLPGIGGQGVGVSNPGCSGGQGGKGGNGGPGGGGLGGPSIGIAFQGSAPMKSGETSVTPGTPGAGGPGGSVNVAMNAGAAGVAGEQQEFP